MPKPGNKKQTSDTRPEVTHEKMKRVKTAPLNKNSEEIKVDLGSKAQIPQNKFNDEEALHTYISGLGAKPRQKKDEEKKPKDKKDLGYYDLPRKTLIESLRVQEIYLKPFRDNGRGEAYYKCVDETCNYQLFFYQSKEAIQTLTTATIIANFKNLDLSVPSSKESGVCKVTEYESHIHHHNPHAFRDFVDSLSGDLF